MKTVSSMNFSNRSLFQNTFALLLINYVFIDLVRRFFDGSQILLLFLDINIIAIYMVFFVLIKNGKLISKKLIKSALVLSISAFIIVVLIQSTNQEIPSLLLTLAGFRTYLLPIPMIAIGYYIASSYKATDYYYLYRLLKLLVYLAVAFAGLQCLLDLKSLPKFAQIALSPMTPGTHNYGDELLSLTTSFFASSKRFASFLLFSYLIVWGIARNNGYKMKSFSIIVLLGLVIGGARDSLWLFIGFHLIYYGRDAFSSRKSLYIIFSIFLPGIIFAYLLYSGLFDAGTRWKFLFATEDMLWGRIILLFPFLDIDWSNPHLLTGLGLGRYGQETVLLPSYTETGRHMSYTFFHSRDFFNRAISYADSGLTKITIELGIIGLTIFSTFAVATISAASKAIFRQQNNNLLFSLGFYTLAWLFYILKAHVFMGNMMMASLFYLSLGYISYNIVNSVKQKAAISI